MPKAAKKKKSKDFQKVKLKVGRKLARNVNETVPQVRVGRVQIKAQYRVGGDTEGGPNKRRKVDVTELLGRCGNCSASIRHEALASLHAELALCPPALLAPPRLTPLFRMLAQLFVDRDKVVRAEARRLLGGLLGALAASQGDAQGAGGDSANVRLCAALDSPSPQLGGGGMPPAPRGGCVDARSHPLLLLGLCRAMTHIDESIQLDSLHILDLYLHHCPRLVIGGSANILADFLPLISAQHQAQGAAGGGKGGKGGSRALLVNPSSRLASQRWRGRVLERLERLLGLLAGWAGRGGAGDEGECGSEAGVRWDDSLVTHRHKVRECVETLVPLLLDCWVETGVTNIHETGLALDESSVAIVRSVLAVLRPMLTLLLQTADNLIENSAWLSKTFEKKFVQHFIAKFPYRIRARPGKKQKQESLLGSQSSLELSSSVNLSICAVMASLLAPPRGSAGEPAPPPAWVGDVAGYLVAQLEEQRGGPGDREGEGGCGLRGDQLELVFRLVETLVSKRLSDVLRERLLQACVRASEGQRPMTTGGKAWFDFLTALALKPFRTTPISTSVSIQQWIATLPQLLLLVGKAGHKDASDVLAAVSLAGRQRHRAFLGQFNQRLDLYLDEDFMRALAPSQQLRLAETFAWVGGVHGGHLERIADIMLSSTAMCSEAFCTICDTLVHQLSTASLAGEEAPLDSRDFLRLLVTVMMATKTAALEGLESARGQGPSAQRQSGALPLLIVDDEERVRQLEACWPTQQRLIPFLCSVVRRMPGVVEARRAVADYIHIFLGRHRVLPLLSAASLTLLLPYLDDVTRGVAYVHTDPLLVDGLRGEVGGGLLQGLALSLARLGERYGGVGYGGGARVCRGAGGA